MPETDTQASGVHPVVSPAQSMTTVQRRVAVIGTTLFFTCLIVTNAILAVVALRRGNVVMTAAHGTAAYAGIVWAISLASRD